MEDFTLNEANKIVGSLRAITLKLEKMDLENISKNLQIFQENIKNVNKIKKQVIVLAFLVGALSTFVFLNFLYANEVVFFKTYKKVTIQNDTLSFPVQNYSARYSTDNKYIVVEKNEKK